jgi:hypothetical protein
LTVTSDDVKSIVIQTFFYRKEVSKNGKEKSSKKESCKEESSKKEKEIVLMFSRRRFVA